MHSSLGQQNIPQQNMIQQCQCTPQNAQNTSPAGNYQTQPVAMQQPVTTQNPQGQNVQVPNYSGVNIQIFNPSVTPAGATPPVYNVNAPNYGTANNGCYPCDYYTKKWGDPSSTANTDTKTTTDKKTEKRKIVQLTDEYIKNLENYLNSQDKDVRLMGAKEVIARFEEDDSRKKDLALNALLNKMLQDPSTPIRALALGALTSGIASGDEFSVGVLKQMQNSQSGYGMDAIQATNALLKMSGQVIEKEFEVTNNSKTETKSSSKTETK